MRSTAVAITALMMVPSPAQAADEDPETVIGMSATIGAGFVGFVDRDTRLSTYTGVCWTARLVIGTVLPVSAELAYLGTGHTMAAPGMSDTAALVSHGVEGALRWNFLTLLVDTHTKHGRFDPYLFGGIGYRRYSLTNTTYNRSTIASSDGVREAPVGVGLVWNRHLLVVDVRTEYRYAFDDDLFLATRLGTDSWGASVRVGVEF